MGFFESLISFLSQQDAQPASFFEAGSSQLDHVVHPVTARYRDAVPEEEKPQDMRQEPKKPGQEKQRRVDAGTRRQQELSVLKPSTLASPPKALKPRSEDVALATRPGATSFTTSRANRRSIAGRTSTTATRQQ